MASEHQKRSEEIEEDANRLKRLVQKARERMAGVPSGQTPIPLARPWGELQGLVESEYPKTKLDSMVLEEGVRGRLQRVVRQQSERAILRDHSRFRQRIPPGPIASFLAVVG